MVGEVGANLGPGKIQVASLIISSEAGQSKPTEKAPQAEEAAATQARVDAAKRKAKDAATLLKQGVDPRNVLSVVRLLSGSSVTMEAIDGLQEADMEDLSRKNITQAEKQKLAERIAKKHEEMRKRLDYRVATAEKDIKKMKDSDDPKKKALGMDIEIAMMRSDILAYDNIIRNIDVALSQGSLILETQRETYLAKKRVLEEKRGGLKKKLGNEGEGLIGERSRVKNKDGSVIHDLVKETAKALTGGNPEDMDKAEANPAGYIQELMAGAMTDGGKMNKLVANLKNPDIELIKGDEEEEAFREFMSFEITPDEMQKIAAKKGGNVLVGFAGIVGFLAYVSWQKSQEQNRQ
jgi:hypothetical protein